MSDFLSGHGEKLERTTEQAIAALLSERTLDAAAEKAGISVATLRRWLCEPAFVAEYRTARRAVLERGVGRLQAAVEKAVDTLEDSLEAERHADKIRAANSLIGHAIRGVELLDLAERLESLEAAMKTRKRGGKL